MRIYESRLHEELAEKLIAMSVDWEGENSTYGYRRNDRSDLEGNRVFLAERDGEILGYLLGHEETAKRASSIMPDGTPYFEIEELYVVPGHRSEGIGRDLFCTAEQMARASGLRFLMLSTATKNYKRILHFYLEELGMEFWSARLFKKISNPEDGAEPDSNCEQTSDVL